MTDSRTPAEVLAHIAREFEEIPDDDLEIQRTGGSALAGDLDVSPEVRRFSACLALVAEAAEGGLCNWDGLLDLAYAARGVRA